ncbi:MAG: hypothetical protein IJO02_05860, partial [Clostridia bacterium]|nr:hypothetical protein [Clostridia bacterium]
MKKLCTVLMAVLLAALVLTTAMAADEPMRMTWWGSESSNKIYLGVSDMFSQELGIEVENEYLSWDDYWTKLNTLAA